MIGHCPCVASGLSSHAIARAFGHCQSGGTDHPHDPSDLRRCIDYCTRLGISTERLVAVMAPVSPTWERLVAAWDELVALYWEEVAEPGPYAPRTYARMGEILRPAPSPAGER